MRSRLFANPQTLEDTSGHARALGLAVPRFDACMEARRYEGDIRRDVEQAKAARIGGTPTFLLATVEPGGRLRVRQVLHGAQPFSNFKSQIDALLDGQ